MGAHTSGPWQVDDETEIHKEGMIVASATWLPDSPCLDEDADLKELEEESLANARLLAAAPTMKAVLEELDVGIQFFMENHGDRCGRLATFREMIASALETTESRP